MLTMIVGGVVCVVIVIIALVFLFSGWTTVVTEEAAILQHFGEHKAVLRGGFHLKWPIVDQVVDRLSLRIEQLVFSAGNPTSDDVSVEYEVAVQFKVIDPEKAYYTFGDPAEQIKSYVEEVIRSELPEMTFKEALKNRERITSAILEQLSERMAGGGYEIVNAPVTDVRFPKALEEQMNRKRTADYEAEAAKQEGEALRIKQVAAATAEAEAKKLSGKGVADQRTEIATGIRDSAKIIKEALGDGVNPEEVMQILLLDRHMDTLRDMANSAGAKVIFVPYGPAAVSTLSDQIKNGVLQGNEGLTDVPATDS